MIHPWLKAIRIRFVLASVIAVGNGLGVTYSIVKSIDVEYAALTFIGVICLHISIDLLNDYWDYKRGIDKVTKRTKFSGGSGVLPENILTSKSVYIAGILFLLIGTIVGSYLVLVRGITIAIILVFAIFAVYFYSTTIVNAGLGEIFVAVKGTLIVIGTVYVQIGALEPAALYNGIIIGLLSAVVLLVNSFPDYDADRSKGRRTLVIILGKQRASKIFPLLILIPYVLIMAGIVSSYTTVFSGLCFLSIPFAVRAISDLKNSNIWVSKLERAMASTVIYSRLIGSLLAISYFI
jgi:1,4-dihydroxy-2-naphthoate octaprenyltransferase